MTQEFGPSPGKVLACALLTVFLWWAAIDDYLHLKHNRHEVALEIGAALAATVALVWLLSLKLTLTREAIRYRSLFRSQQLRFRDVKEIYSSKGRRTAFFVIPLWQTCRFVLVAQAGERIVFGSRFRSGCFAGDKVVIATMQTIFRKSAERFNSGQAVSFGPVRVSQKGIWTDGWKTATYPWSEVEGLETTAGGLFLRLSGGREAGGRSIAHVPNFAVLTTIVAHAIELTKTGRPVQLEIPKDSRGSTRGQGKRPSMGAPR